MGGLNGDEFDTMFELVITILFMMIGAFAMAFMVRSLSARVEVSNIPDKIEVTYTQHDAEDPFYFTGYQAYMFAWHMDDLSFIPLSWVGGSLDSANRSSATTDSAHTDDHVTIGVLQSDGTIMPQFYPWRNQKITGAGQGSQGSVQKTLSSIVSNDQNKLAQLYRGQFNWTAGPVLFHLELTDAYKTIRDLDTPNPGVNLNLGGKSFQWVLAPCSR